MTVYVLDSSALIRYVDGEQGADRVAEIFKLSVSGRIAVCISAIQWGEVAGNIRKRSDAREQARILSAMLPTEVEIISATSAHAARAAELKVDHRIAYADAFALDLAMQSENHVLVTADFGFKAVEDLARIEFLPAK